MTEEKFEDGFFDDLVGELVGLAVSNPSGKLAMGWNLGLREAVCKVHNFFGRGFPKLDKIPCTCVATDSSIATDSSVANSSIADSSVATDSRNTRCTLSTEAPEKHDAVKHPSWYCDGGIETLDYIMAKKLDFLLGQVCKYISRAGKKDPAKEIEDLKKARFYLDWKINSLKGKP